MDLPFALTQARALDAVVRHGSFSRAAAELGLTQPAVSMQVRQLETALGLPLVERMGKRAFATRAGELLLEHSARAVRELETADPDTSGHPPAQALQHLNAPEIA